MDNKKQTPLTEERFIEILDERLGIKEYENLGEVIRRLQDNLEDVSAWYITSLLHLKKNCLTADEWSDLWQDKLINIKSRLKYTNANVSQYMDLFHENKDKDNE